MESVTETHRDEQQDGYVSVDRCTQTKAQLSTKVIWHATHKLGGRRAGVAETAKCVRGRVIPFAPTCFALHI